MAHSHEPFVIQREVDAVMVPSGHSIKLQPGLAGFISQALGGSFTLYIEGNLYRLAGADADAIGKDPVVAPELPPNATEEDVKQLAWQQMKTCYDPEIPINIVDLGLIYDCTVAANDDGTRSVDVQMTLTAPGCGHGRCAGAGRARQDRADPHRARSARRAGVRPALAPRHDVARRATADGHDVAMAVPAAVPACILVRHAHAEWPAWRGRDFDRPLTARGVEDAHAAGQALRATGLRPSRIIASAAQRTTQTAQILLHELQLPASQLDLRDALYNADALSLRSALEDSVADGQVVLMVAHNPGISDLARLWSGDAALPPFRPADWRVFTASTAAAP